METLYVTASDNRQIPAYWVPAEQAEWIILMLPALGIKAKSYQELARQLAAVGISVLVEQRGQGLQPAGAVTATPT